MRYLDKILKLVKTGIIKTRYSHFNLIYRRRKKFIFSVDCSGLVEFWLAKNYPQALTEIYDFVYQVRQVAQKEIKRLYSFDFYDFFTDIEKVPSNYWQFIDIHQKFERGDIISFINGNKKGRFGHVMVVDEELHRTEDKIVLRIIDSSQIEHIEDYRQSDKKGIGCGTIELDIQKEGAISICYCTGKKVERQVSVARLKEMRKK